MQQSQQEGERNAAQSGAESLAAKQEAQAARQHELDMQSGDHGMERERIAHEAAQNDADRNSRMESSEGQ